MRILFVNRNLTYGGAETQIIRLANELVSRNHDVAIYAMDKENPRVKELNSGVYLQEDSKKLPVDLGMLWRIHTFIKKWKPDIVHGFLYDGNFYSRVAAIGTNVPTLNSERNGYYELSRGRRIAHHVSWRLAKGVIANSYAGAEFARNLFPFSDEHMHVVWNGTDLNYIDSRISANNLDYKQMFFGDKDVKVACCVGNIKPAKDHLLALDVADLLTNNYPQWRVLFVGGDIEATTDYQLISKVKNAWKDKNLENKAIFCGQRPDAIEIMHQSEVLFSSSLYEGFPNVVLEAMSVGTPTVSTEYSDIRRILPNSWQVVGDRSPKSLVNAILRADKERDKIQMEQKRWVRDNVTIEKAVDKLLKIYTQYVRAI